MANSGWLHAFKWPMLSRMRGMGSTALCVCAAALAVVGLTSGAPPAAARVLHLSDADFTRWLQDTKPYAIEQGVSPDVVTRAFDGLTLDRKILSHLTNQPEHSRAAGEYVSGIVSVTRISSGRDKLEQHLSLVRKIADVHGVPPAIVLAIWGIETNFGSFNGSNGVVRSLATLAASDQRRHAFWRKELVAALKIVQARDILLSDMTGSWAGAMGHTQFMPSTYHAHAVDFDGDGRRDIWRSLDDALASTANYLKTSGWRTGEPWGFEVVLQDGFDFEHAAREQSATRDTWRERGVLPGRGPGWPDVSGKLRLLLPAGADGPAFLVTENFRVLKRYNPSTLYALSVGLLADRVSGAAGLVAEWPQNDAALSRDERIELQQLLAVRYPDVGKADGIIGRKTREAVFAFQRDAGLRTDGYANKALLLRLRQDVRLGFRGTLTKATQIADTARR